MEPQSSRNGTMVGQESSENQEYEGFNRLKIVQLVLVPKLRCTVWLKLNTHCIRHINTPNSHKSLDNEETNFAHRCINGRIIYKEYVEFLQTVPLRSGPDLRDQ